MAIMFSMSEISNITRSSISLSVNGLFRMSSAPVVTTEHCVMGGGSGTEG